MKRLLLYLLIVFGLGLTFSANTQAKEKVKIGNPGWTGATVIANLLAVVVNDKIGGEVEIVPGNNTSIYAAIDRGKGEIDVHPDIWLPNQEAYTNDLVPKGTLKLSNKPYEGNQGYCVSQQFAKKFNITAIEDLRRPEVVKAMDSNGNGKGEFWIGADGWASANVNEVKIRDYKLLDAGIEPIRAAEAVKNARVLDSIKKGEGYAFYCYKPHAIWGMADVVMLEEPKYDPAKYKMINPKADPDWYKKSYVASKDALKQIQIGWATSLEKQSPAIVEFFKNFQLTVDDVSAMSYAISVEKKQPADVARAWINNNQTIVESWLVPKNKIDIQIAKAEPTITPKKKTEVAKVKEPKQEEFKPENKDVDNQAPIIEVAKNLKFESQTFKFKGRIKDKNKFYLTANGRPVKTDSKGRFEIEGFVIDPEQGEQLQLVAIDQWNNRSEQTVNIEVEFKQVMDARSYEKPNPNKVRVRNNDNKVGIIIGIEKYQTLNNVDAPYANRDANAFRAYANRALGIPNQNLKVLIDNKATRAELLKSLKIWLPQVTRGQQKDVYIFFAGHGLASDDGKDLHILPQDGDPILLEDTAISRVEMFELINKVNPNSVTMFFDTCYSGQTRSEQMLVAGLRPVRIVANEQEIPNNYTIFTASDNDETSGSIEQAEHGIFSYYLMKGLEGNADLNKDKTLTNGELIAYLKNNVSQEAFSQNRQQEPMLSGNPDNILIRY